MFCLVLYNISIKSWLFDVEVVKSNFQLSPPCVVCLCTTNSFMCQITSINMVMKHLTIRDHSIVCFYYDSI